jgi:hypothetical protein
MQAEHSTDYDYAFARQLLQNLTLGREVHEKQLSQVLSRSGKWILLDGDRSSGDMHWID